MLLVNPFEGIYCKTYQPAFVSPPARQAFGRVTISNVNGAPLKTGIYIDGLWDVSIIEKINFSPYYLYHEAPPAVEWVERKDWNTYIAKNLTAMHLKYSL